MKKYIYVLLAGMLFYSCSEELPENEPPKTDDEEIVEDDQPTDITPLLCDGSLFIKREYKDYSTSGLGTYRAVMTQKEYRFYEGGEGKVVTYVAETTPRGFAESSSDFDWEYASDNSSLHISVEGGEKFTLNDVEVTEEKLTSASEAWQKERRAESVMGKEEIYAYSVDMICGKDYESVPPYMVSLKVCPSRLYLETTEGMVTYITSSYGYLPVMIGMPCYSENNGPLTYWDSYLYACVNPKEGGFFTIEAYTEEKPFTEEGKMYFYLGRFSKDTESFSMIENGKDYQIE